MDIEYVLIIIVAVFVALIVLFYAWQPTAPRYYLGTVQDFDVSAGGFGSSTKCTIETNETKVVASGSVCSQLKRGMQLYEQGSYYEVEEN